MLLLISDSRPERMEFGILGRPVQKFITVSTEYTVYIKSGLRVRTCLAKACGKFKLTEHNRDAQASISLYTFRVKPEGERKGFHQKQKNFLTSVSFLRHTNKQTNKQVHTHIHHPSFKTKQPWSSLLFLITVHPQSKWVLSIKTNNHG